jgi:acetyltransferase-like isoleucine patch superfamily enzyme
MDWRAALQRLREPRRVWQVGTSLLRGHYYRVKFRLLRRRVTIGKRFRVTGRLDIRGPGTVVFGDDCAVYSSRASVTTPWTHTPEAVLRIGNRVLMTGTRIGCALRIDVDDWAGLADARITDTDFHALEVYDQPRYQTSGACKPVRIGRNAWIGAGAWVLKGVTVGENSVVGAAAVAVMDVPPNAVVMGNPGRVVWRLQGPKPEAPRAAPGASGDGA